MKVVVYAGTCARTGDVRGGCDLQLEVTRVYSVGLANRGTKGTGVGNQELIRLEKVHARCILHLTPMSDSIYDFAALSAPMFHWQSQWTCSTI